MVERLEFPYKTWIMKNDYLMFIGSYIRYRELEQMQTIANTSECLSRTVVSSKLLPNGLRPTGCILKIFFSWCLVYIT